MDVTMTSGPTPPIPELVMFVLLAGMTLGMSVFAMTRRNPVTAVMSLVGAFVGLAGIYATLSAHFLAVLQVLVYAGAIMVLFIFVVMILNREEVSPVSFRGLFTRSLGVLAAAYVLWVFGSLLWRFRDVAPFAMPTDVPAATFGTVKSIGRQLFTEFVFPFEAISVLLLVAIVGGLVVSRSAKQEQQAEETARKNDAIRHLIRAEERVGGALPAAGEHGHAGHGHGAHH